VARYGYIYDVPPDSELVKKLFSFRCESKQMHFMQPFEAAEQAFALLRMLCEKAECKRSRHGELISRVQMYIASRFNKQLSAGEIAGVFRVSREHLSRIFKDETGESIHEYITGIRMKAALSLLRETRLTIKEISQQCGYSQYSVFYKTFTAFFKCKPQEKRPDRRFFTDSELP
jgi:AraC-like DNA-binding protein